MRFLLALFVLLQVPLTPLGAAQPSPLWNPAAGYVTVGQDEPGYRRWIAATSWRASSVNQFHQYLNGAGVAYVVPTWQLLRTASEWQRCGAEPFSMPPLEEWPNVVQTLRYVRDYVVPVVGPVEPVSAYRNPVLNRCAGGAANSVHQHLSAIDFVPLRPTSRDSMMRQLCWVHAIEGPRYHVGLGFYSKLRFHVDSWKFRTWGRNDSGNLACPRSYEIAHREIPPPIIQPVPSGALPSSAAQSSTALQVGAPTVDVTAPDPLAPQN